VSATGIDLIGVPSDLGVRELGVSLGPTALRLAGLTDVLELLGFDVRDLGDVPVRILDDPQDTPHAIHLRSIEHYSREIAIKVSESLAQGRVPVCLGGDHSMAIGSVSGATNVRKDLGVVWIDAHPDANTPETTLTGNIHGMPVAVLLGDGPAELTDILGPGPKIRPETICLLGVRDIDPAERGLVERMGIATYTMYDIDSRGIRAVTDDMLDRLLAKTEGLHVSLDLDALTKSVAPGVGIQNSAGLTLREAYYLCKRLGETGQVVAIDVADMNPVNDIDNRTAHTGIELLSLLLGKEFNFDYRGYLARQRDAARPPTARAENGS